MKNFIKAQSQEEEKQETNKKTKQAHQGDKGETKYKREQPKPKSIGPEQEKDSNQKFGKKFKTCLLQ